MKKFSAILALFCLLVCAGCDWSGITAKVEVARTTWGMVKVGEPIGFGALGVLHAAGILPDKVWSFAVTLDTKFKVLAPRVTFAFEEYDRVKDKSTGEALLQLVADINAIAEQINALITEWNAPAPQIKTFTPLLRSLPADIRKKFLIA